MVIRESGGTGGCIEQGSSIGREPLCITGGGSQKVVGYVTFFFCGGLRDIFPHFKFIFLRITEGDTSGWDQVCLL